MNVAAKIDVERSVSMPMPMPPAGMADVVFAEVRLHDGSTLHLTNQLPGLTGRLEGRLDAAVLSWAIYIYCIAGRIGSATGPLGGYVGEAGDLTGQRPADSYHHRVLTISRIYPLGLALVDPADRASPYLSTDFRRFVEARLIMGLSAGGCGWSTPAPAPA